MCVESGCPVMIHGGTADRCVVHAYERLATAEGLLREYIDGADEAPTPGCDCLCCRVGAFLASPPTKGEACATCGGSGIVPRWKLGLTRDPHAVTVCVSCSGRTSTDRSAP
jgi:hypothetical protein